MHQNFACQNTGDSWPGRRYIYIKCNSPKYTRVFTVLLSFEMKGMREMHMNISTSVLDVAFSRRYSDR